MNVSQEASKKRESSSYAAGELFQSIVVCPCCVGLSNGVCSVRETPRVPDRTWTLRAWLGEYPSLPVGQVEPEEEEEEEVNDEQD